MLGHARPFFSYCGCVFEIVVLLKHQAPLQIQVHVQSIHYYILKHQYIKVFIKGEKY